MSLQIISNDPNWRLLLALRYDDLLPFIAEQFQGKSWVIRFYWALLGLTMALLTTISIQDVRTGQIGWFKLLQCFGLGTLLVFTLMIPLHEGLHGLAYKLTGAPKVTFGANWRKFYFYVVANQFIIGRRPFVFVAVTPFATITSLSVVALFFVSTPVKWVLLAAIFAHFFACAGDVAMLSFYQQHKKFGEMVTFDDVEKKTSYFFVKEK
jgi:hypothetical protein